MLCDARTSNFVSAPLAQLAEQLTLNQRVRGSSPWRRTIVMSRDMLIGCPGTCLFLGEFVTLRHAAFSVSGAWSGFDAAGLAVFVGVDGQFADDFAGVAVDHEDV